LADDPGICDEDLVRLARDGDPVAFRLLVERHQPMVRARAAALCANASDVDDIMQEAFLRAFIALDRLREPDRFAGWLAGIVLNVCRGLRRRDPVTLLPDSPEPPAATAFPVPPAYEQPSADDLDRADALREAMATLPAGQRRAVFLHYYAGLPAAQIGDQAGAARVSLHKARRRLREYLTEHRPDLVPRRLMTTVRIASAEHQRRRVHQTRSPSHLVVLTDDAGAPGTADLDTAWRRRPPGTAHTRRTGRNLCPGPDRGRPHQPDAARDRRQRDRGRHRRAWPRGDRGADRGQRPRRSPAGHRRSGWRTP
jgi:RNA polymerase sigma factor (sigma-70 family)